MVLALSGLMRPPLALAISLYDRAIQGPGQVEVFEATRSHALCRATGPALLPKGAAHCGRLRLVSMHPAQ